MKYRLEHRLSITRTIRHTLQESSVDLCLFLIALTSMVYLHEGAGIIVLGGFLRAEATIVRALFVIVPKFGIVGHTLPIVSSALHHAGTPLERGGTWSGVEQIAAVGIVVTAILLLLAPTLSSDVDGLRTLLQDQLIPWRF